MSRSRQAGCGWAAGSTCRRRPRCTRSARASRRPHPRLHRIVTAKAFTSVLGELQGDQLTRVPRGYLKDHPAAPYLRFKQFLGFREFAPGFATSDDFYPELLRTFKALTPLLRFLNSSIRDAATPPAVLLDGHGGRVRRTGRASHGA